ncbi:hypothetical protein OY671_012698, partial [Metschnikowia pulcherrima]
RDVLMTNSSPSSYDAMLDADGSEQPPDSSRRKKSEAEAFFRHTGITLNGYGAEDAEERSIPFDMVPRTIPAN